MEYAAIYNRSRSRSRYSLHPHQTYLYYFCKSLAYVFCFFSPFFRRDLFLIIVFHGNYHVAENRRSLVVCDSGGNRFLRR